MNQPRRKSPFHPSTLDAGSGSEIYFMTVCSFGRKPIFARDDVFQLIVNIWSASTSWLVGRYVFLPDHIHFFCCPAPETQHDLSSWMKYWRTMASNQWPVPNEHPIWQRDYWDTTLRRDEKYSEKWDYVRNNPVRHGLATDAKSWAYQGEVHRLDR